MITLKQALLNADKSLASLGGERRKLCCHEIGGRFFCDAEILNPKTDDDRQYPIMDLWKSDSDKAHRFLLKFAAKHDFTRGELREAIAVAEKEEGRCHTLWDLVQGMTAHARNYAHMDTRLDFEVRAGKLLNIVAS